MSFYDTFRSVFSGWADIIATGIVDGIDRLVSPKLVRLDEQPDGGFVQAGDPEARRFAFADGEISGSNVASLLRGNRVEINLRGSHFLFRTLELPAQAADFLEGIVRAQIDRLTPWNASVAVFGCSAPKPLDGERMSTIVACTTRPVAMDFVRAVLAFQPGSVAISTESEEAGSGRIKVFEQKARGFLNVPHLSRILQILLLATAVCALASSGFAMFMVDRLEGQKADVAAQIALTRAAMRAGDNTPDGTALRKLQSRKYELPASTIMLEALSQALPDNTYVTELHMQNNKLQLIGISRDAPALIRLIEQSSHFTRATFFAPTTRSASDPGERFHIEARIEPNNTPAR
jgi:general secretion pathway protein L